MERQHTISKAHLALTVSKNGAGYTQHTTYTDCDEEFTRAEQDALNLIAEGTYKSVQIVRLYNNKSTVIWPTNSSVVEHKNAATETASVAKPTFITTTLMVTGATTIGLSAASTMLMIVGFMLSGGGIVYGLYSYLKHNTNKNKRTAYKVINDNAFSEVVSPDIINVPDVIDFEEDRVETHLTGKDDLDLENVHLMKMLGFLQSTLNGNFDEMDPLKGDNRFALCLYLSGAVESIKTTNDLTNYDARDVLRQIIGTVVKQGTTANDFTDQFEEFISTSTKNKTMFHSGRVAMLGYLSNETDGFVSFNESLKKWNTEEDVKTKQVTVMFADIIGSSALAEKHGDETSLLMLQTLITIAKAQADRYDGEYVKSLGDGVLLVFPDTRNAVKAAKEIMHTIEQHNDSKLMQEILLKIGLNVGTPIVMDGDYIGTAVNLAARVCDKAGSNEIAVTGIVRNKCESRKLQFTDYGKHVLKGFKTPIPLHIVETENNV